MGTFDAMTLGQLINSLGGNVNLGNTQTLNAAPTAPASEGLMPTLPHVEVETMVYGAVATALVAGAAIIGRRWYNDRNAQTAIKKEVKRRF
jgi:hypothetical protein